MSSLNDVSADSYPPKNGRHPEIKNGEPRGIELTERPTTFRYGILAWLTVAAALAYLCRNAVGVPESQVREELGLTLEQSGFYLGAFFWTYALFQVPSGWFVERFGSRIALSVFTLGSSAAMLGIGLATGFWLLILGQLIMGMAQAGLMPAACNSIRRWMPLAQRSMAIGLVGAGMQVGAIISSGVTGAMIGQLGWRLIFLAFALPGVFWAIGFYLRFRDDPAEVLPPYSSELALIRSGCSSDASILQNGGGELGELLAIARTPNMWWLCGQQVCRAAGYIFFVSWFPTFLQKSREVSVEKSGYFQAVVLGGGLIGAISGGFLTDWIWRRTGSLRASRSGVGAASLAICSILILGAWFVQSTEVAVFLLAFGVFCAACAGPCAFAAAIDIAGPRVPQVSGFMNMSGNFAAAACPIIVARIFQLTENWNLILLLFAGVYLTGAICWLFVNPEWRIRHDGRS